MYQKSCDAKAMAIAIAIGDVNRRSETWCVPIPVSHIAKDRKWRYANWRYAKYVVLETVMMAAFYSGCFIFLTLSLCVIQFVHSHATSLG